MKMVGRHRWAGLLVFVANISPAVAEDAPPIESNPGPGAPIRAAVAEDAPPIESNPAPGAPIRAAVAEDAPPIESNPAPGAPIRAVVFEGTAHIDVDDLADGLAQHPPRGWPVRRFAKYDPLLLTLDQRRIVSFYRARGFFAARVARVRVVPDADGVRIEFVVVEGRQYTLREVEISGWPQV